MSTRQMSARHPLPIRSGPRPAVIGPRPHAQVSQQPPPEIYGQVAARALELPGGPSEAFQAELELLRTSYDYATGSGRD
jgi:hypothetical protein